MLPLDGRGLLRALAALNLRLAPVDPAAPSLADRPKRLLAKLDRAGVGIVRSRPDARALAGFGFSPRTVIDVGVHAGTPMLYDAFPDAHFLCIDPVAECEARLAPWRRKISLEFHACALGAAPGEMDLHLPRTEDRTAAARASLADFAPAYRDRFEGVETRRVPVTTLDAVADGHPGPIGLKIDTEGFELEVIRGARETLRRTEFVIAEVSLRPRFAGGYRFSELVAEMGAAGFEPLAALTPLRPGATDCDLLFAPWDGQRFAL